jgi:hypothetical protein
MSSTLDASLQTSSRLTVMAGGILTAYTSY